MSCSSSTRKGPSYTWCEAYKNNESYCYALVNEWGSMHIVVSRFVPLIDALDAIYMEKGDAEAKGVRDILREPDIICMSLLLAEVLAQINLFPKSLQTSTLIYNSVSAKSPTWPFNTHQRTSKPWQHWDRSKFFLKSVTFVEIESWKQWSWPYLKRSYTG